MRLIDADDAREELIATLRDCFNVTYEVVDVVATTINNMPTIDAESHWIQVEHDLPKIGEYVLCETVAKYLGKYHVCKFVDKDELVDRPHFDWGHNGFPQVIAWTRFEPYKGVTE